MYNSHSFDQFYPIVHEQKKLIYIMQGYEQNVKKRKEKKTYLQLFL